MHTQNNAIRNQYSVAICPPDEITNYVSSMKMELKSLIGKFGSVDSMAHLTWNIFLADETELNVWVNYVTYFCQYLQNFEIAFTKAGSYSNKNHNTYFLEPDPASKKIITSLMKKFHKDEPLLSTSKTFEPHMSIARTLDGRGLATAKNLWDNKTFDLKFTCDNLAIRKFNPEAGQYSIDQRIAFADQNRLMLF